MEGDKLDRADHWVAVVMTLALPAPWLAIWAHISRMMLMLLLLLLGHHVGHGAIHHSMNACAVHHLMTLRRVLVKSSSLPEPVASMETSSFFPVPTVVDPPDLTRLPYLY